MVTVVGFVRIVLIAIVFFVLILLINQRDVPTYPATIKYTEPIQDIEEVTFNVTTSLVTIADIIRHERHFLHQRFKDFAFPPNLKYQDLTLAAGGQPVRSIVITTWRSGSTFLGEVLNALPENFYHYEPLLDYGIVQIRGPPLAESAINNLKRLLKCDYYDMNNYLEFGKEHIYLFTHNFRLWNACEQYPQYCWNSTFLSEFCKLYPFQSMKVVRLRLKLAEELLKDKS